MGPSLVIGLGLLAACNTPSSDLAGGLLGYGLLDTFPNAFLATPDGLTIPADALPETPTPLPLERIAWRTGFSPAQTSVVRLTDVNPEVLPSWLGPTPGEGAVQLWDLDLGIALPVMAELDAYPLSNEDPALLVRPLQALPAGHRVAVVVTTEATPRPSRIQDILDGQPAQDIGGAEAHVQALFDDLEALGIDRDTIAHAWDYPVGDGTKPLRSALADLEVPGTWEIRRIRNTDEGSELAPGAWKVLEGIFHAPDHLIDDRNLDLAPDGSVSITGTAEADLFVFVPQSVRDAAAGSVPVIVFGHGIFVNPEFHLDAPDYDSSAGWLAQERGAIVVATRWRGLDYQDLAGAIEAANDLGRLSMLTDRLVQGQVNTRTLVELVRDGALFTDPEILGDHGQVLADPDTVYFEGLSMGGIEGAVLLASGAPLDQAVLHITGSTWSTMLERSASWTLFEDMVVPTVPDAHDRQLLYSLSQLWWDVVDPIAWTPELQDAPILLQENLGDDYVTNIGTRSLARSLGLPQLAPVVEPIVGLDTIDGPLPPGSRAYVQLDPQLGRPPDENRPAPDLGSHFASESWLGPRLQMLDFLDPDDEGQIVHHCGEGPCAEDNQGD